MKTSLKKLLPLLLLLTLPTVVEAQWGYTTNNGAITITGYTGPGGAVTIPDTIDGLPVTSIAGYAFLNCFSLTSVMIPDGVSDIGTLAFNGCIHLISATVPSSVTNLAYFAFGNCTRLTGVYFQGNAPALDSEVFTSDIYATVYYFPGTTGWDATFGGRPAVLLPFT